MRIIEELRSAGAPIAYLREGNGYRYTPGKAFELPGIWFSTSELEALFIAEHLLERAEPGLSQTRFRSLPLRAKLEAVRGMADVLRGFAECAQRASLRPPPPGPPGRRLRRASVNLRLLTTIRKSRRVAATLDSRVLVSAA